MKQRIFVAVASLVLAALILLLLPPAHPGPEPSTTPTTGTQPTAPTEPTTEPTTPPNSLGIVRLYSCDPDLRAALTELASEYSTQTGLEVIILADAEDGCQATLQRLMESQEPPTVFCVHSRSQLRAWENTLLDLKDTSLATMLRSEGLTIGADDKWLAIPMSLKAYGLLMNAELLAGVALTHSDISDFASLSTAVQILKDNSVKAFPTPAPTAEDAWYLLSAQEPQHTREFLDLYLSNYNKSGDALTQFLDGKAAFLPGGSWAYDDLAAYTDRTFHVRNLDILPTYIGGAMQYLCDWAWCVNANALQEDVAATLAFLSWLATPSESSGAPIDRLQLLTPFAGGNWYANQLEKKLLGYMSAAPAVTDFDDASPENEILPAALSTYLLDPTDENWQQLWLCIELIGTPPLTE